ncbi:DNA repair protein [Basfia succiniciproducens]|uniref:DNA repair protein n=1 Tax=Basfia succiniciproducens TaxID=653940 RepID=UPI0008BDF69B|nr:DNA repair protein [Basfia succiniciproducens]SEP84192.1 hypothetical protein SAMN02910415_00531 [Basfia succiniciproducens]
MFVHNLNSEQQSVLLYLAKIVAEADGHADKFQIEMVEILKSQSNEDVQPIQIEIDELSSLFTTERTKCSLLLELLGVVLANNDYDSAEQNLIIQYAKALQISNSKLLDLQNWVQKQLDLSQEVEALLN